MGKSDDIGGNVEQVDNYYPHGQLAIASIIPRGDRGSYLLVVLGWLSRYMSAGRQGHRFSGSKCTTTRCLADLVF